MMLLGPIFDLLFGFAGKANLWVAAGRYQSGHPTAG